MSRPRHYFFLAMASLTAIGVILVAGPAGAGPVTNVGSAPYSRLTLYQGVVSVIPGITSALELGYRGEDIAASGDIYLRPGSVAQANGLRICTNCGNGVTATYANVVVPGQLCLYGPNGNVADCRSAWPSGSGGGSTWDYVTDVGAGGWPAAVKYLQPNAANATRAIHIGSAGSAVAGTALDIAAGREVLVQNADAGGKALSVIGNTTFFDATVKQKITVNGQEVYHPGNSGAGSGLDADTLTGHDVTLESATQCFVSDGDGRVGCICFRVKEGATFLKKCINFANRPL